MPTTVDALLCDLHGLFHHFRNTGARAGETAAGLPPGTLATYAYDHPNYELAKVGVLTDQHWADDVEHRLVTDFGPRARDAIEPWRRDRGESDSVMLQLLAQARQHVKVGLLSNFTDILRSDLAHHGIADAFDYVFPSAELGVQKPSALAYRLAAVQMRVTPSRLYFFDDKEPYVLGARHAGLQAELFTGPQGFATTLNRLGIPVTMPTPGTPAGEQP
jgi:putative hydrolase of the HAD superfamily